MGVIREFTAWGVVSEKWVRMNSAKKKRIQSNLQPHCEEFSRMRSYESNFALEG